MTLKADLEALVDAAAGVAGVAIELGFAHAHVGSNKGKGHEFGWYAQRAGIDTAHDTFATAMVKALTDGQKTLDTIAANMRGVAKDFGVTDATAEDDFHTLPTTHV